MTRIFAAALMLLALAIPASAQNLGEFKGYDEDGYATFALPTYNLSSKRVEASNGLYDLSVLRDYRREYCSGNIERAVKLLRGETLIIAEMAKATSDWPIDLKMDFFAVSLQFPAECVLKLTVDGPSNLPEATDFVLLGGPDEGDILIRKTTAPAAQFWDWYLNHEKVEYTGVQNPIDRSDTIALKVPDGLEMY